MSEETICLELAKGVFRVCFEINLSLELKGLGGGFLWLLRLVNIMECEMKNICIFVGYLQ
jgi:hypothetical protein